MEQILQVCGEHGDISSAREISLCYAICCRNVNSLVSIDACVSIGHKLEPIASMADSSRDAWRALVLARAAMRPPYRTILLKRFNHFCTDTTPELHIFPIEITIFACWSLNTVRYRTNLAWDRLSHPSILRPWPCADNILGLRDQAHTTSRRSSRAISRVG